MLDIILLVYFLGLPLLLIIIGEWPERFTLKKSRTATTERALEPSAPIATDVPVAPEPLPPLSGSSTALDEDAVDYWEDDYEVSPERSRASIDAAAELDRRNRNGTRAAVLVGLVAVTGSVIGSSTISALGKGSHAGVIVISGAVLAIGVCALAVRLPNESCAPAFAIAATLGLLTLVVGSRWETSREYVRVYCAYGAVSEAQLASCRKKVTANQIDEYMTPAATNARSVVYDTDEVPFE